MVLYQSLYSITNNIRTLNPLNVDERVYAVYRLYTRLPGSVNVNNFLSVVDDYQQNISKIHIINYYYVHVGGLRGVINDDTFLHVLVLGIFQGCNNNAAKQ